MKKLISLVVASMVFGLSASADTFVANTAKNQRGEALDAQYGGYEATRIYTTAEQVVCTGRCVLAGLLMTSGTAGTRVNIYDTSVTGALAAAELKVIADFSSDQTGAATPRVSRPVRFTKGISVRLGTIAAGESVTVLYVDLDQR